jgi:hypothetical protein
LGKGKAWGNVRQGKTLAKWPPKKEKPIARAAQTRFSEKGLNDYLFEIKLGLQFTLANN